MKVAVFGLGYVGTVTAAGLASRGHEVVGVDVDAVKVEAISHGRSPVVEPGIDEMVAEGVPGQAAGDHRHDLAIERADVSLLCVGTPSGTHGDTDLTYIVRALADLREAMSVVAPPASGFHSVVISSTVPPGTGARWSWRPPSPAPSCRPAGRVGTAMCPEFLREGSGVEDFFDPPFVVVGAAPREHRQALAELFAFLDRRSTTSASAPRRRSSTPATPSTPQGRLRQRDGAHLPASSASTRAR